MIRADAVEAAVDRVGEMLDEQIGLRPEPTLRGRLRRCIRDEVAGHDDDLEGYVRTLVGGSSQMQNLINRVTVQESGFFRHQNHFEVLASSVLPCLAEPVRMWSAGCANGQEAYSLAMVLEEQGITGSIVATDLSTAALKRTRAAEYTAREIGGVSPSRRFRHLDGGPHHWTVNPSTRARVTALQHNLTTELPGQVAGCQIVFCRNVLIYFSAQHARTFLNRLADVLAPGAFLFLGAAESMWQVTDRYQAVRVGDSFVYQHAAKIRSLPRDSAVVARSEPVATKLKRRPESPRPRPSVLPAGDMTSVAPMPIGNAAAGQESLADGDYAAAVVAFRKWVYLAPEDPLALLHLGLALEAGGHSASARRAFGVSRDLVLRVGHGGAEAGLEGFSIEELLRLLDTKQGLLR
jgi:chemotaxis methyl-accepting protein methylase